MPLGHLRGVILGAALPEVLRSVAGLLQALTRCHQPTPSEAVPGMCGSMCMGVEDSEEAAGSPLGARWA